MRAPPLVALCLSIAACSPKSANETTAATPAPVTTVAPSGHGASPEFCRVLNDYIAAADGDFASLRSGEPEKLMRSWAATVALPGAIACRVADKDAMSFGSVFCVLAESEDAAELETAYAAAVERTKACTGWKLDTGEQLQTRWTEFLPPTQKSATRTLQVHVRWTAPVERAKGTVTIDVAAKKPGTRPASDPAD